MFMFTDFSHVEGEIMLASLAHDQDRWWGAPKALAPETNRAGSAGRRRRLALPGVKMLYQEQR